jgi:hypothetical protein
MTLLRATTTMDELTFCENCKMRWARWDYSTCQICGDHLVALFMDDNSDLPVVDDSDPDVQEYIEHNMVAEIVDLPLGTNLTCCDERVWADKLDDLLYMKDSDGWRHAIRSCQFV